MMNQAGVNDHLKCLRFDMRRYGKGFSGLGRENKGKHKDSAIMQQIGDCLRPAA